MMRTIVLYFVLFLGKSLYTQPWVWFYPAIATKLVMENTLPLAFAQSGFKLTDVPGFPVSEAFGVSERLNKRLSVGGHLQRMQAGPLLSKEIYATLGICFPTNRQFTVGLASSLGVQQMKVDWNVIDRLHTNELLPSAVSIHPQGQAVLSCFFKKTQVVFSAEGVLQEPFAFATLHQRSYLLKQVPYFELRLLHKVYQTGSFKAEVGWNASGYKGLPTQTALALLLHFGSSVAWYAQYGYRSFIESGLKLSIQTRIDFLYAWRWHYSRTFAMQGHQVGCVFYLHEQFKVSPSTNDGLFNAVNEANELQWNRLQLALDSLRHSVPSGNIHDTTWIKTVIIDTVWRPSLKNEVATIHPIAPDALTKRHYSDTLAPAALASTCYYAVVMGVYQNYSQAERFRYHLEMELSMQTEVIQLKNQNVYYVIVHKEAFLTTLLPKYYSLLKINRKKQLTNGQPWIYELR